MNYQRKRLAFDALGAKARVYRADHELRYEVKASIPLGANEVVFNTRSSIEHSLIVTLRWTDSDISPISQNPSG